MIKTDKVFDILADVLSFEDIQESELEQAYDELFITIKKELIEQLNNSEYSRKSELIYELDEYLDDMEVFSIFPELNDKTIIGIFGTNCNQENSLISFLCQDKAYQPYRYNSSIPMIITNSKVNKVTGINRTGKKVLLDISKMQIIDGELYKANVEAQQILSIYQVETELFAKDLVLVYFPFYMLRGNQYYQRLLDLLDGAIIVADYEGKWKSKLTDFKIQREVSRIILGMDDELKQSIDSYEHTENFFTFKFDKHFGKWLDELIKPRDNVAIDEKLKVLTYEYRNYLFSSNNHHRMVIKALNINLLNSEDKETAEHLKKLRSKVSATKILEDNLIKEFDWTMAKILEIINRFDDDLYRLSGGRVIPDLSSVAVQNTRADLVYNLIENGGFSEAEFYLGKLKKSNYKYSNILEIIKNWKMKGRCTPEDLKQIREANQNDKLVQKAKLLLCEELNLTAENIIETLRNRSVELTGYEHYCIGKAYEDAQMINEAKREYQLSVSMNYKMAEERLLYLLDESDRGILETLAYSIVPEANYILAKRLLSENRFAQGITNLKIAASFEHKDAMKLLINVLSDGRGNKSSYERTVIQLCHYIHGIEPNNYEISEKLGIYYYKKHDYRRALQLLKEVNSESSNYLMGRIYQYGNGVVQDLKKAERLFSKAEKMGSQKAGIEKVKVAGWIAKNEEEKTEDTYYRTESTTSDYSSSFCFITTATCTALGKGDQCEELQLIRWYRDSYLMLEEDGVELIKEYYRIAPMIIEKIDNKKESKAIYRRIFQEYICKCYKLISNRNYKKAKEKYIEMVMDLANKYGVSYKSEIKK